jgi:hypothetical protein
VGSSREPRPSARFDARHWENAHDELLAVLQALIRLPTVNPPGDEIVAASYVESLLEEQASRRPSSSLHPVAAPSSRACAAT